MSREHLSQIEAVAAADAFDAMAKSLSRTSQKCHCTNPGCACAGIYHASILVADRAAKLRKLGAKK